MGIKSTSPYLPIAERRVIHVLPLYNFFALGVIKAQASDDKGMRLPDKEACASTEKKLGFDGLLGHVG